LFLHEIRKEKRDKVISEMKRTVKKNGILIFVDFNYPMPESFISFLIRTLEFLGGKNNFENFKSYLREEF
jgi:ubiquinone/menaquinone biosynthesis C-methylase UbiE